MNDMLKAYGKYAFAALVILFLGSLVIERSCRNPHESKEYLQLKGQFEQYKMTVEEADKVRIEARAKEEAEIKEILAENEELEREKREILEGSLELNEDIEKKNEEIRKLREEEESIENLKKQNILLESNFKSAIADRDREKAARLNVEEQKRKLQLAYDKKDGIIAGLEKSLANEKKLRLLGESIIKEGEKGRPWHTIELVITRGFAVYGLFSAGKAVFK